MRSTYSFYDSTTGKFSSSSFCGNDNDVAMNTPPGYKAIIGVFDHLSQKFDVNNQKVVDYIPTAPPNDNNQTWEWDATTKRWRASPTLPMLKSVRIAEIQSAIEAQEKSQDRPQRELMSAFRLSLPAPAIALNKMVAIDNEIARLRGLRSACSVATTKAQLDAVARP